MDESAVGIFIGLFIWIIIAIVGVTVGVSKGYNGWLMALLCIIVGPIVALILLFVPPNRELIDEKAVRNRKKKYCDFCRMAIPWDAVKCAYCLSEASIDEEKKPELTVPMH